MTRLAEPGALVAVGAVILAAVLGGAFTPGPKLAVAILLAVATACSVAGMRGRLRPDEAATLAVIGWASAVAVARGSAPLAGKETVAAWLAAAVAWAACRRCAEPVRRVAGALLAGAAAVLAAAVAAEWAGLGVPRAGGLLENPNVTASLLAPTAVAAWSLRDRRRTAVYPAAVAGVLLLGVLLTGSRAALVALAAAAAALPRGRRTRVVVALVAAAAVASAVTWRLTVQRDVLAWHRPAIWGAILGVAAEQPIAGVGPGAWADHSGRARISYDDALARHEMRPSYGESTPVALFAELGLVGLALAVVAAAAFGRQARRRDGPRLAPLLVAMAAIALLHDLLRVEVVLWWWAALLGLAEGGDREPAQGGRRWGALAGIAAAGLLLWGLAAPAEARRRWQASEGPASTGAVERAVGAEPWWSAPPRLRAEHLLRGPEWGWEEAGEAIAWSERAVAVHPGSAACWSTLGQVGGRTIVELGATPGLVARTRDAFREATRLEPHLPWWWLEWARLERALGELRDARRLAERAVAEEPAFVRGWLLLARIELDLGRVAAARDALDRAREVESARRPGLRTPYERELLRPSRWQREELEAALR